MNENPTPENKSVTNAAYAVTPSPSGSVSSNGTTGHTNSDSTCSNGSGADDALGLKKPKRQRRSYSCGPCKLLKIKCDLQVPCASCKKFKRIDKCILYPPQPPSDEELWKIKERKKRSNIKKLRLTNNYVQAFNSNNDSIPSLALSMSSTSRHLESTSPNMKHTSVDIHRHPIPYPARDTNELQHTVVPPFQMQQFAAPPLANQLMPLVNPYPPQIPEQPQYTYSSSTGIINNNDALASRTMVTMLYDAGVSNTPKDAFNSRQISDISPSTNGVPSFAQQLEEDEKLQVEVAMVDIKKMKRLLPSNYSVFADLVQLFLKSFNDQILDIMNFVKICSRIRVVYDKILQINDEGTQNLTRSVTFSIIELRHLSFMYLILANGYLFDNSGLTNFLVESTLFKPKQDIIDDWIKTAKFIRDKLISYAKITDILYLMDWYFIIKNYYLHSDMLIENYLEFNNLLNYVVLNNQFIEMIEDPEKDTIVSAKNGDDSQAESDNVDYPKTQEFKVVARYWMQLRLIEMEFTFFQFKGSLLSSNQLKTTIVPHKKLLQSLYGYHLSSLKTPLVRFAIQLWGLYYQRSRYSTSIRDIIKSYLGLYSDITGLVADDVKRFKTNYDKNPNLSVGVVELTTLVKNQMTLHLLVRWLSFIRIESTYFPSLRYTSYMTSMSNLFNHFHLLDDILVSKSNGTKNILSELLREFPYHYMKNFYQCLIYQSIFVTILQDFILPANGKTNCFKIDLVSYYNKLLRNYNVTVNKFLSNTSLNETLHFVTLFKRTINLIVEFSNYISSKTERVGDITELIYNLKTSSISYDNWEILINFYFGSRESFMRYIEKIWDLLEYLSVKEDESDESFLIPITTRLFLNDELLNRYDGKLVGFEYASDVVNDYLKVVVDPNIQE
ncbi:uncharacterized protein RJT20DRAFT_129084 [Scheffersomyces xylosifermentans]|uniref:uncharacterized protein n=1 Tax=Scheffersomyces xylosifermentans TaxID=1304137 RepID=UPI00315DFE98